MDEYNALPEQLAPYPHQVGEGFMFGPTEVQEVSAPDLLNHSCNPNVGFSDALTVVALKDIREGEAVTIDYAFSESFEGFQMTCRCGSDNCRGTITSEDWKLESVQRYLSFFQPYLKERVRHLQADPRQTPPENVAEETVT